jgi:ATP-dependent DNA ligase
MTLPFGPPLKPMLAKGKETVPTGSEWLYEPKWDGFRAIVYRDGKHADIRSRNDRPLDRYFPEVVTLLLDGLPDKAIVDGEIILPSKDGLAFDDLQMRLHPAESRVNKLADEIPASFVVFDLLAIGKDDLRKAPLSERLEKMNETFGARRPKDPTEPAVSSGKQLFLTPCTDDADTAQGWFVDLEKVKLDGIIAKRLDLPYAPGERVMIKVKHRRTADCVVGGYRPHKHGGVGSLLLGLYEDGKLGYIGHTASFNAAQRRELLEILEPMRTEESFEGEWGPGEPSRWSGGKEAEWVRVEPKLVCEVSYDYVQSGYRFRHAATFMRWRDDKRPEECTFDQVRTSDG